MPKLSKPNFSIKLVAGTRMVDITGTVTVTFSSPEETLIKLLDLTYKLKCELWGADAGLNGEDDYLLRVGTKNVKADGTYTLTKRVDRGLLNDDWGGDGDEVYAKFGCTAPSDTGIVLTSAQPISSAVITGEFGG